MFSIVFVSVLASSLVMAAPPSKQPESVVSVSDSPPTTPRRRREIAPGASWANQAWEIYDDPAGKDVVLVDLQRTSKADVQSYRDNGQTVICYMSAGTVESWRTDAYKLNKFVSSSSVYPGEKWLNLNRWRSFSNLMARRMDAMVNAGCSGVEADNLDCYLHDCAPGSRTKLMQTQLTYARWLADAAHSRGLLIGLKNALEIAKEVAWDFDFAINESCTRFNECYYYNGFTDNGKAVFGVEYSKGRKACTMARQYGISMKYRSGGSWHDC
eukprot:comp9127_c0_seq1/m.4292 comp9127_c0_seq1/g.4292  ORF comp9127_c0_seq1/g.4292 comp9127_c0_seq1/m.4292 type:complete len:270 (-) comp9127_c0_seq1:826-1635(-)